jgi:preprotein translocase subunit SecF
MTLNVVNIGSWQNYGVDFTGGSLIQIQVDANLTAGDLRDALGGADAPPITRFGEESEFVVRAPVAEDGSIGAVADTIEAQLAAAFGQDAFEVVRTEQVGAKVGGELQVKALYAILFSFIWPSASSFALVWQR